MSTHSTDPASTDTTSTLRLTGMTCAHCVRAVTNELAAVPGVSAVSVALVAGGVSTVEVTSATALDPAQVRAAVDEAGYALAEPLP